jgi:hypothetical protein
MRPVRSGVCSVWLAEFFWSVGLVLKVCHDIMYATGVVKPGGAIWDLGSTSQPQHNFLFHWCLSLLVLLSDVITDVPDNDRKLWWLSVAAGLDDAERPISSGADAFVCQCSRQEPCIQIHIATCLMRIYILGWKIMAVVASRKSLASMCLRHAFTIDFTFWAYMQAYLWWYMTTLWWLCRRPLQDWVILNNWQIDMRSRYCLTLRLSVSCAPSGQICHLCVCEIASSCPIVSMSRETGGSPAFFSKSSGCAIPPCSCQLFVVHSTIYHHLPSRAASMDLLRCSTWSSMLDYIDMIDSHRFSVYWSYSENANWF